MKDKIIKLRNEGKTYNEIKEILGCSKSTISYHCSRLENNDDIIINNINKNKNYNLKRKFNKNDTVYKIKDIDLIDDVKKMRHEKKTYKEISESLNISYYKVKLICCLTHTFEFVIKYADVAQSIRAVDL